MAKWAGAAVLALLMAAGITTNLWGRVAAPPPLSERVANADLVFVGKVTAIEDKTVQAKRTPDDAEKTEFSVALVQIAEPLKGAKGLTTVRLGFVPAGGANPRGGRGASLTPTVGQEACFFVTKHADGNFHVAQAYFDVIDKKAPEFEQDVSLVRRIAKLMDDPMVGLKSKDADERLMTAAMLLTKYRTPKSGQAKTEPIAAEESKLILEALAAGDFNRQDRQIVSPRVLIGRLGLTPQDGWNPPVFKDVQKEYPAYAQQWLKDNAGKYRIQRFVP